MIAQEPFGGRADSTGAKSRKAKPGWRLDWHHDEDDADDWEPPRKSKIMEEPCNPRTTRRHGSVGLMEGLGKRKRPRKTPEGDCGPGADALVAKRAQLHGDRGASNREQSQKPSGPAVVVDLTKDTGLSETQKLEYEAVSNAISSSVESSRFPKDGEDPWSGPLVSGHEQIGNGKVGATCAPRDRDMGDSPESLLVRTLTPKVDATDLGAGEAHGSVDRDNAICEANSRRPRPDLKENTPSRTQTGPVSPEQEVHIVRLESPSDIPPAKPPDKRRRGRLKGKKDGAQGDDMAAATDQYDHLVLTEDIGLPPEVYNPRPSRSRGAKAVEVGFEGGMGKAEGRVQSSINGRLEGIESLEASTDFKPTEGKACHKKKTVHLTVDLSSATNDGERKAAPSGASGASAADPSVKNQKENAVFSDAPSSSIPAKAKSRITAVPDSDSDSNSDSDSDRLNGQKVKPENKQALLLGKPETATPREDKEEMPQGPSTDRRSAAALNLAVSADKTPATIAPLVSEAEPHSDSEIPTATTIAPLVSEAEPRSDSEIPTATTIAAAPTMTLEMRTETQETPTEPYNIASPSPTTRQTQGVSGRAGYRVGLSKRARIQPLLSIVRK